MNVIFLDIDGVLNSVDSMIAFNSLGANRNNEETLDLVSIGLLKHLVDKTSANIVVSSTWRIRRTVFDLIRIFENYGWSAPIIDVTCRSTRGRNRGGEIQEWLDEHKPYNYVIIDDDSDMLPSQLKNFIHVQDFNGFRLKHLCIGLDILGFPDVHLEKYMNFNYSTQT